MLVKFDKNVVTVDNYKQIYSVKNDLIKLINVNIYGLNMKIKYLDKDRIIIVGDINKITFGDE